MLQMMTSGIKGTARSHPITCTVSGGEKDVHAGLLESFVEAEEAAQPPPPSPGAETECESVPHVSRISSFGLVEHFKFGIVSKMTFLSSQSPNRFPLSVKGH